MGARGRKSKAELMVVLARAAELAEQTAQGSRDSRHHIEAAPSEKAPLRGADATPSDF
jgi:hypothetical protein